MAEPAGGPTLGPGERAIWRGRPVQGWRLRPCDLVAIPFSLAVGIPGVLVAHRLPDYGPVYWVFTVVFDVFFAYVMLLRFPIDWQIRRTTTYVVTQEHVTVASSSGRFSTTYGRHTPVTIDAAPGGKVNVRLEPTKWLWFRDYPWGQWSRVLEGVTPDVVPLFKNVQTNGS